MLIFGRRCNTPLRGNYVPMTAQLLVSHMFIQHQYSMKIKHIKISDMAPQNEWKIALTSAEKWDNGFFIQLKVMEINRFWQT